MNNLLKNLLIVVALGAILWFGWRTISDSNAPGVTAQNGVGGSEAARDAQQFLTQLQELEKIDFEDSLFTNPEFRSLIDYRRSIINEPAGRPNPFAPVE